MDKNELEILWNQLVDYMVSNAGDAAKSLSGFLSAAAPADLVDDTLTIAVKTEFSKLYIERHYDDLFKKALIATLGFPCNTNYITDPSIASVTEQEKMDTSNGENSSQTIEENTSSQTFQTENANDTNNLNTDLQQEDKKLPTQKPAQPQQEKVGEVEGTSAAASRAVRQLEEKPSAVERSVESNEFSVDPVATGQLISGRQIQPKEQANATSNSNISINKINPAGSYNPRLTFETFVVGENNEFANAAALKVAETPGKAYNPLFIYGNAGLGKTHLLNAIANYVIANYQYMRVLYVTSEDFVNDVVAATRYELWEDFMLKYRAADVFLLDDVQFLEGKETSITSLFNTFNALKNRGAAIVLSADRPPKELDMDERMRSRFIDGLNVEITAPNFEVRFAILKNYVEQESVASDLIISDDVLMYIAKISTTNIRELDGAISKIIAYMRIYNMTSL
jgi:chromosomal replication initiator protein DnaA